MSVGGIPANRKVFGTALLPRAGIDVRLTPSLTLRAGGGRYAQVLRSLRDDESVISSFIAYDILALQPTETGLARSWDLVAGVDWEGENGSVRVSAYTREMDGLLMRLPAGNAMERHPLLTDSLLEGSGRARGVELQAFRRLGDLQLGVSYALSDVRRSAGGRTFTPRFARTHTLDATASLPFGSGGLLSTRLSYATGQPYTPVEAIADGWSWDAAAGEWRSSRHTVVNGEFNSARLPSYTRLDVAVRRDLDVHWFGRDIALTPYFQVLNILNAKNVVTADPEAGGTTPRLNFLPQLPVLPTFGIEWRF